MGRTIEKTSASAEVVKTWCEKTTEFFCDVDDSRLYNTFPSSDGYEEVYIANRTRFVAGFSKTHALRNLLNIPSRSKNVKLGLGTTGDNDVALLAEWHDEDCREGASARVLGAEDEVTRAHYEELSLLRSLIPEATTTE